MITALNENEATAQTNNILYFFFYVDLMLCIVAMMMTMTTSGCSSHIVLPFFEDTISQCVRVFVFVCTLYAPLS